MKTEEAIKLQRSAWYDRYSMDILYEEWLKNESENDEK